MTSNPPEGCRFRLVFNHLNFSVSLRYENQRFAL